ncbi:MAG: sugar transferase [Pseudomonadota bacterium]
MVHLVDVSARSFQTVPPAVHAFTRSARMGVSEQSGWYRRRGKRLFDIAFVCATALIVVPLVAALALLVAFRGGTPIYRQARLGQNGRIFHVLKLRTMVPDADRALARLLETDPQRAAEWHATQKLRDDPRVTPLGRVLRATSLDELPQFWNVLRGDMSLIGPRPMMVDQRALYEGAVYCDLRPGLSGLWQVSARHAEAFSRRVDYDREYATRLSFWFDVQIMLRTVGVVLRGTGC